MRVFVAGATGAIGKHLVPMLVAAGHDVTGTTTSAAKQAALGEQGAEVVMLDVLDRGAVMTAVVRAEPDVVIHEATALSGFTGSMRGFDRQFAHTNRLRTQGRPALLDASSRRASPAGPTSARARW